ncbi:ATP-binding protein [Undibacterium terreum]|uniref:ORC1/DEAH AAA+ ATPase domain-containing protein n=1 Tax=Undibacterium terreum TaxID=1224302 RepID=A0A916XI65_9BURK|nr:ATP-binding protein [Undibacterium terreum]GGC75241.1 hypothetical protein GCM10011396_23080 [Undibacterium terreum]
MIVDATYLEQNLPRRYIGNPLLEALPPIANPDHVVDRLFNLPNIDMDESRRLPNYIRLHDIDILDQLYLPRQEFIDLEQQTGLILRNGLLPRNPFDAKTQRYLDTIKEQMRKQKAFNNGLPGTILFTGPSGTGKTTGIRNVLSMLPQAIQHIHYGEKPFKQRQVVWLSLDAPVGGSIKGLLLRLFRSLDECLGLTGDASYFSEYQGTRMSIDAQIENFAAAATTYFTGLIHIDDLQRVTDADEKLRKQIYNFILQIANVAKIPLILSGTSKSAEIFGKSFEVGRRTTTSLPIILERAPTPDDDFFSALARTLFDYQWTPEGLELTPKVQEYLWHLCQGISSLAITIYKGAQKYAVANSVRKFKIDHLEYAYKQLRVLHPAIEELRKGGHDAVSKYEDLLPDKVMVLKALQQLGEKKKSSDKLNALLKAQARC